MRYLDRLLKRFFLPRLLARACGDTIHRSGPEALTTNCFLATIRNGDEPYLVLLSMQGTAVAALQSDGHRYATPVTLELNAIDPARIDVTHFYGLTELRFPSLRHLAFARFTGWPYLVIHVRGTLNKIAQHFFNLRNLEIRRRLDILRDVVEATSGKTDSVTALDLMSQQYGDRWYWY